VGAVTALLCIPVSTATVLVDVASCIVSSLIINRVVLDWRCLLSSRRWLLMDQHLLLVSGQLVTFFCGCSSASRS